MLARAYARGEGNFPTSSSSISSRNGTGASASTAGDSMEGGGEGRIAPHRVDTVSVTSSSDASTSASS